ncbi:hypothetical protein SO694_0015701 [Aureococcus anophagefferens]|uniref:Complex 1 LYR protein domain-containing protein n=1 Tax=Aureococcus anophagefferens TaxID=44056 RepID=A0ABR1G0Q2_AURAN
MSGQALSLYRAMMREATKVNQYNFRHYAVRRVREDFRKKRVAHRSRGDRSDQTPAWTSRCSAGSRSSATSTRRPCPSWTRPQRSDRRTV